MQAASNAGRSSRAILGGTYRLSGVSLAGRDATVSSGCSLTAATRTSKIRSWARYGLGFTISSGFEAVPIRPAV